MVSYDDINKIVNINAIVKNNTQDDTNFTMVFCIYNGNQLVGVYTKEGSVKKYNETAVDGFINIDNFKSNYTVSTILLDDLNNISPLCDKATY